MNWVSERRFLHFIEDIKKLFAYKKDLDFDVKKPVDEKGTPLNGEAGQFLVSNGDGSTQWKTVEDYEEVLF